MIETYERTRFDPWEWAWKALVRLREDAQLPEPSSGELVAVLIGKAQVGKTSLALRLLGATRKEAALLSEALRGAREIGESATPVPIVYERSDEFMGNIAKGTLERIRKEIENARRKMEEIAELPLKLPLGNRNAIAAKVVDLVGLSAREETERKLALRRANEWLQRADLVIYVLRAEHIVDLSPQEGSELRPIMNKWRTRSGTSIFAITYAYETILEKDKDELENITDAHELFKRCQEKHTRYLKEQLNWRDDDAKFPLVLPLDLSTGQVDPIREQATELALGRIKKILVEKPVELRVRGGFSYSKELEEQIRSDGEELERRKRSLEEKVKIMKKKMDSLEEDIRRLQELRDAIQKEIREIEELTMEDTVEKFVRGISKKLKQIAEEWKNEWEEHINEAGPVGSKVQTIRKWAEFYLWENDYRKVGNKNIKVGKKNIVTIYDEAWKDFSKDRQSLLEGKRSSLKYEIRKDLLKFLRKKHDNIRKGGDVIVKGAFWGVKWGKSVENLQEWAVNIAREEVPRYLRKTLSKRLSPVVKKQKSTLREKRLQLTSIEKSIREKKKEKRRYSREMERFKEQYQEKIDEINHKIKENMGKLEKARKYMDYIVEEFLKFRDEEIARINRAKDPVSVLDGISRLELAREVFEELTGVAKDKEE